MGSKLGIEIPSPCKKVSQLVLRMHKKPRHGSKQGYDADISDLSINYKT
jgi:hypothetical protein